MQSAARQRGQASVGGTGYLSTAELRLSSIAGFALSTFVARWRYIASADVVPWLVAIDLFVSVMLEELTEHVVGQVEAAPSAVHAEIVIMEAVRAVHQRTAAAGTRSWRYHVGSSVKRFVFCVHDLPGCSPTACTCNDYRTAPNLRAST